MARKCTWITDEKHEITYEELKRFAESVWREAYGVELDAMDKYGCKVVTDTEWKRMHRRDKLHGNN